MVIEYAPVPPKRRPLIGRPVVILILVVAALLAAKPLWYQYTPAGRQRRNMDRAAAYLPRLLPIIRMDARFDAVNGGVTTGHDGAIALSGYISSEEDRAALQTILDRGKSEANILLFVRVDPQIAKLFKQSPKTTAP